MTKAKRITTFVLCLALTLLIGGELILSAFTLRAVAAENESYSNVLTDLSSNPDFKATDYPANPTDNSLNVINIGESAEDELFVYVYQPSVQTIELTANYIAISLDYKAESDVKIYPLTLLNRSGTLAKYRVDNFVVSQTEEKRYYAISSIWRPFCADVDEQESESDITLNVEYAVAKVFTALDSDVGVLYSSEDLKYLDITSMFVDHILYYGGFQWQGKDCCSHYVAFDADFDIDELFEAELSFTTEYPIDAYPNGQQLWINETTEEDHHIVINDSDVVTFDPSGWFADYQEWFRIRSVDDFLEQEGDVLFEETKEEIKGKQWVLSFYESYYEVFADPGTTLGGTTYYHYFRFTDVSNVTLLRLKFKSNRVTYNLPAVSAMKKGDFEAGGEGGNQIEDFFEETEEWFKTLAILIIVCVLMVFFTPFVMPLINFIGKIFKFLLDFLLWIIGLPFRFFKWLLNKKT